MVNPFCAEYLIMNWQAQLVKEKKKNPLWKKIKRMKDNGQKKEREKEGRMKEKILTGKKK